MPHLTLPIIPASGPCLEIAVGVSEQRADALRAKQLPIPQPVVKTALVDTGASCSCVDPDALNQLGLQPTGKTQIRTPSTGDAVHAADLYDVSIYLVHSEERYVLPRTVQVVASVTEGQRHDVLLGRDILSQCLLVYDGREETFALAF